MKNHSFSAVEYEIGRLQINDILCDIKLKLFITHVDITSAQFNGLLLHVENWLSLKCRSIFLFLRY